MSKSASHTYLVSRLPNNFKDTGNHEAQAQQEEVWDHQCSSNSSFLLNQGVLWSTLVYEISNYVCSYITYTKESCFGLETSPFYSHKLYSLCDIFQATMCHMFIDTGFVYHIHIQSYNRSIHLKMVHRMGLSSSKTIS